jgi:sugar phosphate isomerase/epimerase
VTSEAIDAGASDAIGWVLWAATLGLEGAVTARAEAARANGFERMSLSSLDVARAAEAGTPPEELGRALRGSGLELVMDPVVNWHGDASAMGRYGESGPDEVLRMCEALQVVSMSAIGPFGADEVSIDELAERFGGFCDRAGDVGAQVHLEFMPFSAVADLATAWAIVEAADRDNGGLLFDTWHFFRGDPDFALLDDIPGARIFAVQVSDAPAEIRGSLGEDTFHRLMPGDGCFDLPRALRTLDRIGGLRWVGPEVLSPVTAAMPPVEAARRARDCTRELIARVRSSRA